jgi:hypothetical protein
MINDYKWSLRELEEMMFWEREIYVKMLVAQIEERKQLSESKKSFNSGMM